MNNACEADGGCVFVEFIFSAHSAPELIQDLTGLHRTRARLPATNGSLQGQVALGNRRLANLPQQPLARTL